MFGGAAAAFAYWFFIDAHHPKVQHEDTYLLNINVSTKRVLFKCCMVSNFNALEFDSGLIICVVLFNCKVKQLFFTYSLIGK